MNVNKPLLFWKDGVMLEKVKETKIKTQKAAVSALFDA